MIIWGAMWGAIIGLILPRNGDALTLILGGILGALAGWTLRKSVRNEFARLADQAKPVRAAAARAQAANAAIQGAVSTSAQEFGVSAGAANIALASEAPTAPAVVTMPRIEAAAAEAATAAPGTGAESDVEAVAPQAMSPQPPLAAAAPGPSSKTMMGAPIRPAQAPPPDPVEAFIGRIKDWLLGGNTVARVGTIVLFIGLSFLAKWAADNNLFPPELRLAAIGMVGIALLVQGFRVARRSESADDADDDTDDPLAASSKRKLLRSNYGYLLQGAGVAVLYLTIFAAFKLYGMIPALAAFVLMALVCALSTVLALLADKQMLAFAGFAGAFATPILVSTGSGNHVALFSYYLLLNVAIGVVAWLRAWRALNLLGFFATFGVATLWGTLKYSPALYASTQPFLVAFFAIYVLIGLFYALRHSSDGRRALDGILIFGTPIVSFMLQTQLVSDYEYGAALSAVAAGAIYVALALFVRRRDGAIAQWLVQSYAAMALVFLTLSVPLAFDGRMTAAIWAIEGAGVFWLSLRQQKWLGQVFGALMQILAAMAFIAGYDVIGTPAAARVFANAHFVGCMMLATGALLISWWSYRALPGAIEDAVVTGGDAHSETGTGETAETGPQAQQQATSGFTNADRLALCDIGLFVIGFIWLLVGVWTEITSPAMALSRHAEFAAVVLSGLALAAAGVIAWNRTGWTAAYFPSMTVLPFLLLAGAVNLMSDDRLVPFWFNFALWPLAIGLHLFMLRRVDQHSPRQWWALVHTGNVLLLILVVGSVLDRAITAGQLRDTDWAAGILLTACALLLLALCAPRIWDEPAEGWPFDRFQREYALHAGFGVAALALVGALIVAITARGNAAPLPYVPLLNPVDLIVALSLAAVALWIKRTRNSTLIAPDSVLNSQLPWAMIAFAGFIFINTVWLRLAHHWRGIPWRADSLAGSFFVQAGYSVLWTLLGVGAMWLAHRRGLRRLWQVGAALLGLTVLKLLVVDLANSGGGERIVAFIGVGLMMVAIGYFAPLPPAAGKAIDAEAAHAR